MVAGRGAGPGTRVPARPPTLSNMPCSSQLLPAQCLCPPGCSLGPPAPPTPPLLHPILSFITTAREYLNCLLFLALRIRERSLPDSGAPLLPRGPCGDGICSVSCPAQPQLFPRLAVKLETRMRGTRGPGRWGLAWVCLCNVPYVIFCSHKNISVEAIGTRSADQIPNVSLLLSCSFQEVGCEELPLSVMLSCLPNVRELFP